MNSIPASEIKRRGLAAVDEMLKSGPVHVIKHNQPQYVIQSEQAYQADEALRVAARADQRGPASVWAFIQNRPWQGTRTKSDIDAQIAEERASWNEDV